MSILITDDSINGYDVMSYMTYNVTSYGLYISANFINYTFMILSK